MKYRATPKARRALATILSCLAIAMVVGAVGLLGYPTYTNIRASRCFCSSCRSFERCGGDGRGEGMFATAAMPCVSAMRCRSAIHCCTIGLLPSPNTCAVSCSVSDISRPGLRSAISCTIAPPIE